MLSPVGQPHAGQRGLWSWMALLAPTAHPETPTDWGGRGDGAATTVMPQSGGIMNKPLAVFCILFLLLICMFSIIMYVLHVLFRGKKFNSL